MRPLRSLFLYVGVIFLGAALLSPWLYWLAHWAGEHSSSLSKLGAQPFPRYVNRSLLAIAVVGLWPFLRSIGANSWAAVGLVKSAGHWRRLAAGFVLGFASLACVALVGITGGARILKTGAPASDVFSKILAASGSAVVVAVLEELLFRGALFGALRKAHRWPTALLVSSAVYALVHFFQKPVSPADINWSSGLQLMPRMLGGFAEMQMLVPGFFTLFLAGMILGLAYQRTGNLYLSMGLHAGWIFWVKFYRAVTVENPEASQWFWGSSKLIDGWFALAVLLPVLLAVWRFPIQKKDGLTNAP